MKKIITIVILITLFHFSCSSNDSKTKNQKSTTSQSILQKDITQSEDSLIKPVNNTSLKVLKNYSPKNVCDCSKDGIKVLTKILNIRENFKNVENYNKDLKSVQNVSILSDNFIIIRDECLKNFATQLLNPSDCNDPYKIRELRDKLRSLGIQTN